MKKLATMTYKTRHEEILDYVTTIFESDQQITLDIDVDDFEEISGIYSYESLIDELDNITDLVDAAK